jgi:hypothetical protein
MDRHPYAFVEWMKANNNVQTNIHSYIFCNKQPGTDQILAGNSLILFGVRIA